MSKPLLSGLIAAPFTPFDPHGRLNLKRVPALAADLKRNGVTGAFVCGTTGEGSSLTVAERIQVAEAWAKARPAGLSLIVHVGHNCLDDSVVLAKHAASIDADAIGMMSPSMLRPATLDDLVECCAYVAKAAPTLPFYYYHMPTVTAVNFEMAEFLRVAAPRIPSLAGVKFTHDKLLELTQAHAFDAARYAVLNGRDEILIAAYMMGVRGAVGSTFNYMAPVFHRMMQAIDAGDLPAARRIQAEAIRIIDIMLRYGGLPAAKSIMKLIGLDCGGVRLPLRSIGADAEARMKAELEAAGLFEVVKEKHAPRAQAPARQTDSVSR